MSAAQAFQPSKQLQLQIEDLWRSSFASEDAAFKSAKFRLLEQTCVSLYGGKPNTRLSSKLNETTEWRHRQALERFFRYVGAPWYEAAYEKPDDVGKRLHAAYTAGRIKVTYFVPLNELGLHDKKGHTNIGSIRFDPCEIGLLSQDDLNERIPVEALDRFGASYRFPADELAGMYWLIVPDVEDAGCVWKRDGWSMLDMTWDEIGRVPLYESTWPPAVEDALFVLLLYPWGETSIGYPESFRIPWVYTVTDDPFAQPSRGPDLAAVHFEWWDDHGPELKVPARNRSYSVEAAKMEAELNKRWSGIQALNSRAGTGADALNPLTRHFFIKGFVEEGIDQLLANVFCLEATFLLPREGEGRLKNLVARFLHDKAANKALNMSVEMRHSYVHVKRPTSAHLSFDDLVTTRWVTRLAVDKYLEFAASKPDLDRDGLLKQIDKIVPSRRRTTPASDQ